MEAKIKELQARLEEAQGLARRSENKASATEIKRNAQENISREWMKYSFKLERLIEEKIGKDPEIFKESPGA